MCSLVGDQARAVFEHRGRGGLDVVGGFEGLAVVLKVEAVLDPIEQLVSIPFGDPHEHANRLHRELTGDRCREVAGSRGEGFLDELHRAASELSFQARDRPWRETLTHEHAYPLMA